RVFAMHFSALRRGDTTEGIVASIRDVTVPLELGRERTRSHLLAELLNLSTTLNSELSIAKLTERVVEVAMTLLGARSGTLGLVERDRLVFRRFHRSEGWVDFNVVLHPGEGSPGYVWQTRQPHVSNDCESDPQVLGEIQKWLGFKRIVTVPVLNRAGNIIGTLGVYDPIVERDFGQPDVEALQLLAHQAAIAIENARLSELKDEFLSIVSHELKTPVTSIKGFAQVLKRRLPPEALKQASQYLDVIDHQSDRLARLINHLLDLSRIQTGRFRFDLMPVDYSHLVRDVVDEMRLLAQDNAISLVIPDHVTVQGNSERLRQVLVNLIDNAIKHGPVGGTISLTVEEQEEGIVTCVGDEGPTLPAQEADRIFQPYYQVRPLTESYQSRGLGLGLFISRQIIEEHRGRIWLAAGACTTFCFIVSKR
ncbi:MAG TPA: GAF domain-containing sensor histidine kinase, partial [Chloroflexota bacterium]